MNWVEASGTKNVSLIILVAKLLKKSIKMQELTKRLKQAPS